MRPFPVQVLSLTYTVTFATKLGRTWGVRFFKCMQMHRTLSVYGNRNKRVHVTSCMLTVPEVQGPGGWRMERLTHTLREACSTQLATAQTWQATLPDTGKSRQRHPTERRWKGFQSLRGEKKKHSATARPLGAHEGNLIISLIFRGMTLCNGGHSTLDGWP